MSLPKKHPLAPLLDALDRNRTLHLPNIPDGFQPMAVADLARGLKGKLDAPALLVHVARDGARMDALEAGLGFVAPDIEVLTFPGWDCQPYDRVSPNAAITARRMMVLARLARTRTSDERPRILLTTVNALLHRAPPHGIVSKETFSAAPGNVVDTTALNAWLETNGYARTSTVRDTGDYALRGGIIDLFPSGLAEPIRLDFFGDTLESIRVFNPETQRSTTTLRSLDLVPMSEVQLTTASIKRFRQGYVAAFGAAHRDDVLYSTLSEGRRYPGFEHWLPLFYEGMDTLFDYLPKVPVVLDDRFDEALDQRLMQIADAYDARKSSVSRVSGGIPYNPLSPEALYLTSQEMRSRLQKASTVHLTVGSVETIDAVDLRVKPGRSFAVERAAGEGASAGASPEGNVFEAAVAHIRTLHEAKKRVLVTAWTAGSRERLAHMLADHGLKKQETVHRLSEAMAVPRNETTFAVWGMEAGFEADDLVVLCEQDLLGDRLVRNKRRSKRAQDYITEAASLAVGDLVVHADHGIGRFARIIPILAMGVPHDCLELHYANTDKLFLPVENIDLLSRYGSEDTEVALDRLSSTSWQGRKERLKKRIREMAGALIKIAAARALKEADKITTPEGVYDEFCARFPFDETEDQANAIQAVLDDLASGRPMDRLVCGDVGFGKTEVALRAAFVVAFSGKQVAVVVPTTLLARQHYKTFADRFAGLPVRIAHLSRFVSAGDVKAAKAGLADGTVDIVIGTHALLAKTVHFKDLGLVVVDEEQHFGVTHKERLKDLRSEVHVLTLSATPIPRTLQLAMTGVRDLSIIATPPVDRLAVRTFITPFDPLTIREALLRERYRGGQAFYVCPRIEDIDEIKTFLAREVPEVRVVVGHGQMAAGQLEDVMTAFYDGKYDVLLSTTIVESGLDVPTANTLIVHRADMFGLSQLYQIRGRVGRSKTRAYALLTIPAKRQPTVQAERRLRALESLDTLGAGFQLASHDLDIRGAGNLLGDEQSGHIREVGYDLYQQMLDDAIASLKAGFDLEQEPVEETHWSPAVSIGTPVVIPEDYVADLSVRLSLYRRISKLESDADIEAFGAELIDRFGPMPEEINQLLKFVAIRTLCRRANVEKVEAGPKGMTVAFRDGQYANPEGLVSYIAAQGSFAKVKPDMKLVFVRELDTPEERLKETALIVRNLARIAEKKAA